MIVKIQITCEMGSSSSAGISVGPLTCATVQIAHGVEQSAEACAISPSSCQSGHHAEHNQRQPPQKKSSTSDTATKGLRNFPFAHLPTSKIVKTRSFPPPLSATPSSEPRRNPVACPVAGIRCIQCPFPRHIRFYHLHLAPLEDKARLVHATSRKHSVALSIREFKRWEGRGVRIQQ